MRLHHCLDGMSVWKSVASVVSSGRWKLCSQMNVPFDGLICSCVGISC